MGNYRQTKTPETPISMTLNNGVKISIELPAGLSQKEAAKLRLLAQHYMGKFRAATGEGSVRFPEYPQHDDEKQVVFKKGKPTTVINKTPAPAHQTWRPPSGDSQASLEHDQ